jgi:hypothetical protein
MKQKRLLCRFSISHPQTMRYITGTAPPSNSLLLESSRSVSGQAALGRKRKAPMSTIYFPDGLFLDILCRLPPKSLFRFRCVCKTWYKLIGNPDLFTPNNPFNQNPNPPPLLLVKAKHASDDGKHMLCFLSHDTMKLESEITMDVDGCRLQDPKIVASCNGLICLREQQSSCIYIWNPAAATSQGLKSLPPITHPVDPKRVGFGFDRRSNDFKVLVVYEFNDRDGRKKPRADVYSLSTGAWRQLHIPLPFKKFNPFGYINCDYYPTTTSDGFFFWWEKASSNESYKREKFVEFDFSNEVFRTTPIVDGIHFRVFTLLI